MAIKPGSEFADMTSLRLTPRTLRGHLQELADMQDEPGMEADYARRRLEVLALFVEAVAEGGTQAKRMAGMLRDFLDDAPGWEDA